MAPAAAGLRAGVDVGGTFTDVVVLDALTGSLRSTKVPTDYADPIAPIVAGLWQLAGASPVKVLHHATTLSTNAVIEGRLASGVLLTTEGFRDVLDIGRIQRPAAGIYDFNVDNPQPLVRRRDRLEVRERLAANGAVVTPLDEAALRETLAALAGREDLQMVAICCLFSFVNPDHEARIAAIVAEMLPDLHVSVSHQVSPEIREFERTSTVVLDAALKPLMAPYLRRLHQRMGGAGVEHTRIMLASGGLTDPGSAAQMPVHTVNSGPAAGVLGAASLGRALGEPDLVTIDMGGTSLDIGVVEAGRCMQTYAHEVAGYPLRVPAIDVAAVAAGGGSLAAVDALGFIQVDRASAGSTPGPACYGRGGSRPTITDADLLLGRLGVRFGGRGGLELDPDAAGRAFDRHVCAALGVDREAAAASVLDIIQARMLKAIAANTMEKGLDVRPLPLLVYGGAGPTHGAELAEAMGMGRVLVPYLAGNFSAVGLLLCPLRWDESMMLLRAAEPAATPALTAAVAQLDARARERIGRTGAGGGALETRWRVHMRYAGQSYDLPVDGPGPWTGDLDGNVMASLLAGFHALHARRFAYVDESEPVELVQVRVQVMGEELAFPRPPPAALAATTPAGAEHGAPTASRHVYFTNVRERSLARVVDRRALAAGDALTGPAVVEGEGASTLVPPGWRASVDGYLNLDMTRVDS